MKVIGAGFPRTGTMSTWAALQQLGFNPCYHFISQMERPDDPDVWQAAAEGRPVDWLALLGDFEAAVDWPASAFYKQLMAVYPQAKVLLTMRDPETWYSSVSQTVYPASKAASASTEDSPMSRAGRAVETFGWQELFQSRFTDKAYAISVFQRHNQEVIDSVPASRLLVWEVKEGWEPLCRFLDVAVPDGPFPRLNDLETFRERFMPSSMMAPA